MLPFITLLPIGFCSIISPPSLLADHFVRYLSNNLNLSDVNTDVTILYA